MVDALEQITGMLRRVDKLRDDVNSMPGGTEGMAEAKREAQRTGALLFDAVTEYQRSMLNELYRRTPPGTGTRRSAEAAIKGTVGKGVDA